MFNFIKKIFKPYPYIYLMLETKNNNVQQLLMKYEVDFKIHRAYTKTHYPYDVIVIKCKDQVSPEILDCILRDLTILGYADYAVEFTKLLQTIHLFDEI